LAVVVAHLLGGTPPLRLGPLPVEVVVAVLHQKLFQRKQLLI
jgi:hypothetical protein